MRLTEAFEKYRLEYVVFKNQSRKTEEQLVLTLRSMVKFLGDIEVDELTMDSVRRWRESLTDRLCSNSIRGYIIKLRSVLRYLRRCEIGCLNYELVAIPKREDRVVGYLDEDEVRLLVEAAFKPRSGCSHFKRYRNRAMVSLLYASGIRNGELCQLDIDQVVDSDTFTVMGKGGKARLCFLDRRTRKYLDDYLDVRDGRVSKALFVAEMTGERIHPGTVQMVVQVASRVAGLKKRVTPHMFRHSFATNLLKNGTNLIHVSKFLGHDSVQTTQMYTHVVDQDLAREYIKRHSV